MAKTAHKHEEQSLTENYQQALDASQSKLDSLQAQRAAALATIAGSDPAGSFKKLKSIDAQIHECNAELALLQEGYDQASAEDIKRATAAAAESVRADIRQVLKLSRERVALATEADHALAEAQQKILRLADSGRVCHALLTRAIENYCGTDQLHAGDILSITLSRAAGTSDDDAIALATHIRALSAAQGAPSLTEQYVTFNPFTPKGQFLFQAAQNDYEILKSRLAFIESAA